MRETRPAAEAFPSSLHSFRECAKPSQALLPRDARVLVAGSTGLAGSAIVRRLEAEGFANLLLPTRRELDLRDSRAVHAYFREQEPAYVFLAAAKVGGILANSSYPADFIHDNLQIQINVIDSAFRFGARKLLFLGSSCIYPKFAPQPIPESALLGGALEPTNSAYAVAKIAGIEMCRAYRAQHSFDAIALMPTNLYGPGDDFQSEGSHVVPALIRRFHHAKVHKHPAVTVWGSGEPRREFLHVDDLADACLFCMERYSEPEPVNVGTGLDLPIAELAGVIKEVTGYRGGVIWDREKPDGTPRKLLDTSRLTQLGWRPHIQLKAGLRATYDWYCANVSDPVLSSRTA